MFGITETSVGTERLAYRLVWAYARMVIVGQRPTWATKASAVRNAEKHLAKHSWYESYLDRVTSTASK